MACFQSAYSTPLSRRSLIAAGVAAVGAGTLAATGQTQAASPTTIRAGTLAFGTGHWMLATIIANGFDTALGIKVENTLLASGDAARIAFLGGSVDTIIADILFSARLKSEGKPVRFLPYSTTEGALVAPAASPIRAVADLAGTSIGVAGGPLDKSWLLLRAEALRTAGLDLAKAARPVFGAAPLLGAKVESGELDCGLLYWSTCARLEAKGYRRVVGVEDIEGRLGASGKLALGGYLLKADFDRTALIAFAKALRRTDELLASDPKAWDPLRPLMQAPDEATFDALKAAFIRGIPKKPRDAEIADTQAFYAIVAQLGGPALVGEATTLPADLYVDQVVYG